MPSAGTKKNEENMDKVFLATLVVIGGIAVIVGLALLFAIPTLLVVNYLFTTKVLLTLFGIPKLTFWKAFWLNFLSASLLKSYNYNTKK